MSIDIADPGHKSPLIELGAIPDDQKSYSSIRKLFRMGDVYLQWRDDSVPAYSESDLSQTRQLLLSWGQSDIDVWGKTQPWMEVVAALPYLYGRSKTRELVRTVMGDSQ